MSGWWYTYPLKNMKVSWDDYSQYMENIFAGWWGKRTSKKKGP